MKEAVYLVIDLETSVKNKTIGNSKGSPFYIDNKIVAVGGSFSSELRVHFTKEGSAYNRVLAGLISLEIEVTRLIGHNIKFDIHYLRRYKLRINNIKWDKWVKKGCVWDTQLAEYILTGQQNKFAKLDELGPEYGGTPKLDEVKLLWDAGVDTEDIDEDLLLEYLEGDVKNTENIALQQMQKTADLGLMPLMEAQMDACLAIQEMEYNGLEIDQDRLTSLRCELALKVTALEKALRHSLYEWSINSPPSGALTLPKDVININSPKCLATVLFGGKFKWEVREKVGVYKNGNDKFKKVVYIKRVEPIFTGTVPKEWEGANGPKTNDTVLTALGKVFVPTPGQHIILQNLTEDIKMYRKMKKELGTYYEGLFKLIFHDGKIHPNINQCLVITGRTSCSNPNTQNIPDKKESQVKSIFVSRWGDKGNIVEVDYHQLEVIVLAFLSKDKQLIADILSGTDVHAETGRKVFPGRTMTKGERRSVKGVNFGLIYGGGATTLAEQTGTDRALVKKIIAAFYTRYPGAKEWQDQYYVDVCSARQGATDGHTTKKGYPSGISQITSEYTGRTLTFREYDSPDWIFDKDTSFSPMETKNYPVQSLATGDILPTMLGRLFRVLKNSEFADKALLINTVHDSIVLDIHDDVLYEACELIKATLEGAPEFISRWYGMDFNLPLTVEITSGPNWKEQKELDLD